MTVNDIRILAELLMILEHSEGDVYSKIDNIFDEEGILPREYKLKIKGIAPLQVKKYDYWGYSTRYLKKFRPVIEVHLADEVISLVFNRENTTLIYDINSKVEVGPDSKGERVYEDLAELTDYRSRGINKHKLINAPNAQIKALREFLQAVLLD